MFVTSSVLYPYIRILALVYNLPPTCCFCLGAWDQLGIFYFLLFVGENAAVAHIPDTSVFGKFPSSSCPFSLGSLSPSSSAFQKLVVIK